MVVTISTCSEKMLVVISMFVAYSSIFIRGREVDMCLWCSRIGTAVFITVIGLNQKNRLMLPRIFVSAIRERITCRLHQRFTIPASCNISNVHGRTISQCIFILSKRHTMIIKKLWICSLVPAPRFGTGPEAAGHVKSPQALLFAGTCSTIAQLSFCANLLSTKVTFWCNKQIYKFQYAQYLFLVPPYSSRPCAHTPALCGHAKSQIAKSRTLELAQDRFVILSQSKLSSDNFIDLIGFILSVSFLTNQNLY